MNITDEDDCYIPRGPIPYGMGGVRSSRSKRKSNLRVLDVKGIGRIAANRTSDIFDNPE